MNNDGFDNPVPTTTTYALNVAKARRAKLFATVERLAEHGPAADALLAPFVAAVEAGDETVWDRMNTFVIECDGDVAVLVDTLMQLAGWQSRIESRGYVIISCPKETLPPSDGRARLG